MKNINFKHQGFTLLEVLVSVVVLSFGLLGMAGLQAVSLHSNNTAYLRTQATMSGYDILDSMRANRDAVAANSYNVAIGAALSGSTMADTDVTDWKASLANLLPNGDGSILCDANNVCTVAVQWSEQGAANNGTQDFVLSAEI